MDFRTGIAWSREYATRASAMLGRIDPALPVTAPVNQGVIDAAKQLIAPGATRAGADALDAARFERWVSVRQLRDTGHALELLDAAWWSLSGRGGTLPDVAAARRSLTDAVAYLDRAVVPGRWLTPAAA